MKKFFFLLLLIIGTIGGAFAYFLGDYYFQVDNIQKLPNDLQTGRFQFLLKRSFVKTYSGLPLQYSIALYEHLPGIFQLKNICYYTEEYGEGRRSNEIIFPGRHFPPEKAIRCSTGEEILLQKESSAFVSPSLSAEKPHIFLDNGTLNIRLTNSEMLVSSRMTTIQLKGNESTSLIVATRTDDGLESFVCNEGKVVTSVLRLDNFSDSSSLIANRNCSLTIQETNSDRTKNLDPGMALPSNQVTQFIDGQQPKPLNDAEFSKVLSGSTSSLPENTPAISNVVPQTQAQTPNPNSAATNLIQISLTPKTPKGDVLLFRYTLPQPAPMVCDLKTGPSANGPFSNAYQFQAPSKTGTLDLQKGFQAFHLVLHCTNGRTTVTSNVIPAKK